MSDTSVIQYQSAAVDFHVADDDAASDLQCLGGGMSFPSLLINQKIPTLAAALPEYRDQFVIGGKNPFPVQHEDGSAVISILGMRFVMHRRHSDKHEDPDLRGRIACAAMRQPVEGGGRKFVASVAGGVIPPHYVVNSSTREIVLPDVDMPPTNDCSKCGYGFGRCGGAEDGRGFAAPSKIKLMQRGKPWVPSKEEAKALVTKPAQTDCQATIRAYVLVVLPDNSIVQAKIDFKGSNFATGQTLLQAWSTDNKRPGANGVLFLRRLVTKRGTNTKYDYLSIESGGYVRTQEGKPALLSQAEWEDLARPLVNALAADPVRYYASVASDSDDTSHGSSVPDTALDSDSIY